MKKFSPAYLSIRGKAKAYTRNDLYAFNRHILRYPDILERIHKPMCDHFLVRGKGERDFALLIEPRGSMKTSFCVIGLTTWVVCFDSNSRILIYSATHDKAKERLFVVKKHLQTNRLIPFLYYDAAAHSKSKVMWKSESIVVAGRSSTDLEPTVDTGGRGIDKTGSHYGNNGWVIIDDLENEKTIQSQEELEATKRYLKRLFPCMLPKRSYMRIVGTIWSDGDVYSMIMGTDPEYKGKYDYFRIRVTSAEKENGSLYYPELLSQHFLKIERDSLGDYLYACLYLSNPVMAGSAAFPPANTMWWYGSFDPQGTAKFLHIEKVNKRGDEAYAWKGSDRVQLRLAMLIDPALSEEEQACYSAIVIAGKDMEYGKIWVVDALRLKSIDPYVLIKEMIRMYHKYEPNWIILEDYAYQRSLKDFFEKEARQQRIYCKPDTVGRGDKRGKFERILGLQSYWQSDSLMLPGHLLCEDSKDNAIKAIRDELYRYPKARYNDLSDALSRILDIQVASGQKNMNSKIKAIEEAYRKQWRQPKITD